MPYIFLNMLTLAVGAAYQLDRKKTNRKKCIGLGIVWAGMTLLAGLRGLDATSDTLSYYYTYTKEPLMYSFIEYFLMQKKEFVFYLSSYSLSRVGIPWQLFLLIEGAFLFGVMLYWLYLYSDMPFLSCFIFQVLFLNMWVIAMRCGMAMAFMILAYICFDREDTEKGILFTILGVFSHNTVLIFVPLFFIRKKRFNNVSLCLYSLMSVAAYVYRDKLLGMGNTIAGILDRNMYEMEEGQTTYTFLAMFLIVIVLALAVKKYEQKNDKKYTEYLHAMFCALVIHNFVGGGVKLRLAFYYAMFLCLLIPMIIKHFKPRVIASWGATAVLFFLYLHSMDFSRYYFFWQEKSHFIG